MLQHLLDSWQLLAGLQEHAGNQMSDSVSQVAVCDILLTAVIFDVCNAFESTAASFPCICSRVAHSDMSDGSESLTGV